MSPIRYGDLKMKIRKLLGEELISPEKVQCVCEKGGKFLETPLASM
jgi:hypothetical protein